MTKSQIANWRNIAEELDPKQVDQMVAMESRGMSRDDLLEQARFFARDNLGTSFYFGSLPPPTGAVEIHTAGETTEGIWIREFEGTRRDVTEKDEIRIEIGGAQYPDGTVERYLTIVYRDQDEPGDIGSLFLDSADGRRLGAALIEASNEINRIAQQDRAAQSLSAASPRSDTRRDPSSQ